MGVSIIMRGACAVACRTRKTSTESPIMANETTAPEEKPANEIKERIEAARAFAEEKYEGRSKG